MTKQQTPQKLFPARAVRDLFGVSGMTIWRWRRQGLLPEPVQINGRNFWPESAITAVTEKAARAAQ